MNSSYFEIQKNGVSPFQNFYVIWWFEFIQTVGDNPVTAYRQLLQQYAKDAKGNIVSPEVEHHVKQNKYFSGHLYLHHYPD